MSIAKLVVLGALEQLDYASGYDIMQELNRKMIDKWTDIKKASIYHALRQLEKEGAIRLVEQVKNKRFPTKTIYTITEEGQQLFDTLQEQAFLGLFPSFYGFKIALKFNTRRTAPELKQFAERAIAFIDNHLAAMDNYLSTLDESSWQYKTDAFYIEHDRRLYQAEKEWIQESVENLTLLQADPQRLSKNRQNTKSEEDMA